MPKYFFLKESGEIAAPKKKRGGGVDFLVILNPESGTAQCALPEYAYVWGSFPLSSQGRKE